eukprot:357826-Chlamydomonas_euryale.AAC.2
MTLGLPHACRWQAAWSGLVAVCVPPARWHGAGMAGDGRFRGHGMAQGSKRGRGMVQGWHPWWRAVRVRVAQLLRPAV